MIEKLEKHIKEHRKLRLFLIIVVAIGILFVVAVVVDYIQVEYFEPEVKPWHNKASATFNGGDLDTSGVTVTDVFQVEEEAWTVRLSSYDMHWITGFLGKWSLEFEIYEEGKDDDPLRSVRGTIYHGFAWYMPKEGSGSEEIYWPELPQGKYYLKIYWEKITWMIDIVEEIPSSWK